MTAVGFQETMQRILDVAGQQVVVQEYQDLQDEAGAVVWDAALVLSHYLIKQGPGALHGQCVLEMGSGTGVVGLVAAALGANTTLTDLPHLLQHLQHNAKLNAGLPGTVTVAPYAWGDEVLPLGGPWDLIIGSDLCYVADAVPKLLASLATMLAHPGSCALMSYELRPGFRDIHEKLPEYGLQATQVPMHDLAAEWCSPDIEVWRIWRDHV